MSSSSPNKKLKFRVPLDEYNDLVQQELDGQLRRPEPRPNLEQWKILQKGVQAWNKWRAKNPDVEVNLSGAYLRETNLMGANLKRANLSYAELSLADLRQANLGQADLREANLDEANLSAAYLSGANLSTANLRRANLRRADLSADLSPTNLSLANLTQADLRGALLTGANLSEAILLGTDLGGTHLYKCNFWRVALANANFANSELSGAIGLEDIEHGGPSTLSTDVFIKSKGNIPEIFLRGCGLSDWEIASAKLSNPDLSNHEINEILYKIYDLRATQALQISPLFISYSHADREFVNQLANSLTEKGIRYWRDIHDMKAGRMERQIDLAIRQNPTVLLVLSKNSQKSDWVQHEVRTARELEKEMGRDVLCPVALDKAWEKSSWPKRIMEQVREYNILDFSAWEDDSEFGVSFNKLIDGLELFYK